MWFEALVGHRIRKKRRLVSAYFRDSEIERESRKLVTRKIVRVELLWSEEGTTYCSFRRVPHDAYSGYRSRWYLYSRHVNCYHAFENYRWISTSVSSDRWVPHVIVLTSDSSQGLWWSHSKDKITLLTLMSKEYFGNYFPSRVMSLVIIIYYNSSSKIVSSYELFTFSFGFPVISFQLRHFFLTDIFKSHSIFNSVTERRVRRDFSSWFSVRVICATSIGSFVTYNTLDVFFSVNVEHHFLQSSWWPQFNRGEHFAEICLFSFYTGRFFCDVALIDFFCSWRKALFCFIERSANASFGNMSKTLCVIKLDTTSDASVLDGQWTRRW